MNTTRGEFNKIIEEFISFLAQQKKISPHTQRCYKTDLEQFSSSWDSYPQFNLEQALQQYVHLIHQQALVKRSVARKLSCIASFIRFTELKNLQLKVMIKRPHFERKKPRAISIEELNSLLNTHPESLPTLYPLRDKAIIELLYATGITSSELVRICLDDVCLTEKTIRIIGKKNCTRIVFFGSVAHQRILDYVRDERIKASNRFEPLFLSNQNTGLTTRSIQKICTMFNKFLSDDLILTPHVLRHSFATHLLENGISKKDLKDFLGYKALLSTEQYAHVLPKSFSENEF